MRKYTVSFAMLVLAGLLAAGGWARPEPPAPPQSSQGQSQSPAPAQPQSPDQNIPDAPSATRPAPSPFPSNLPPGPPEPAPPSAPAEPAETQPTPAPLSEIKTVPAGTAPRDSNSRDDIFKIVTRVNFVIVPVTVKNDSGGLVEGLLSKDFSVYEDGVQQKLQLFTSDPFPLSAAVVLDLSMPDVALRKVKQTFPALAGSFSQFDEISIYTYGNTVSRALDFSAAGQRLTAALDQLKTAQGRTGGVPVAGGPLGSGPSVNGRPLDPSAPTVNIPPRESHVLNDAILQAALDLGKRERARRKVIFVISDGRESGSNTSYSDVLKVLLSQNVAVYAVAVDSAALPGYSTLEKLKLPRMGYTDILPKYASATGGEVFREFSRQAIESAYARLTGEARNQYTLGYTTRATPSSSYREIEVRVHRSGLRVYAKTGYYPLPPGR